MRLRLLGAVLPLSWVVFINVSLCALYFLPEVMNHSLGMRVDLPELRLARAVVVYIACGCYGLYRVRRFHPALKADYLRWLRTTPWTARHPLPLGPVHLVWQDVVIVGMLTAWEVGATPFSSVIAPLVFLGVYTLALCLPLALTGATRFVYATLFLLGLVIRLTEWIEWAYAAVLLTYGVAQFGYWRSLATFPWRSDRDMCRKPSDHRFELGQTLTEWGETARKQKAGWPFEQLRSIESRPRITREHKFLFVPLGAALVAWAAYIVLALIPDEPQWHERLGAVAFLTAVGAFYRCNPVRGWPCAANQSVGASGDPTLDYSPATIACMSRRWRR